MSKRRFFGKPQWGRLGIPENQGTMQFPISFSYAYRIGGSIEGDAANNGYSFYIASFSELTIKTQQTHKYVSWIAVGY